MNSDHPPSSHIPGVPTFQNEDQLSTFLQSLIQTLEQDSLQAIVQSKDTWITVVSGLSDNFLTSFPVDGLVEWAVLRSKIRLVDWTLQVIQRVVSRIHGVFFGTGDLSRKIFARLLDICCVLDQWTDVQDPNSANLPSPRELRDSSFQTAVDILRNLAGKGPAGHDEHPPTWQVLRDIIAECGDLMRDLIIRPNTSTFPFGVRLFKEPRVQTLKRDEVLQTSSQDEFVTIIISKAEMCVSLLAILPRLAATVVAPPMISELFLEDVVSQIAKATKDVFEYLLTRTSPGHGQCKVEGLLALAESHEILSPQSSDLGYRLLKSRLLNSSASGWDAADAAILSYFKSSIRLGVDKDHVVDVVRLSHKEDQTPETKELAEAFVHASLSRLPPEVIKSLEAMVDLAQFQDGLNAMPPNANSREGHWRRTVLQELLVVLRPQQIEWMDDDDSLFDEQYAQRLLDDICTRLERPLIDSTAGGRLSVLDTLEKLLSKMPPNLKLATLSLARVLLDALLKGQGADVTSDVRRRLFAVVPHILRWHVADATEKLPVVVLNVLLEGMRDKSRNVRLCAGAAYASLVEARGRSKNTWPTLEEMFDGLYMLIESSKTSVQETVLVIVGRMTRTSDATILGLSLCFLVSQIGRTNLLLKGAAVAQIISASKFHKKPAPYPLLLPYMDRIAPFIISRICSQPDLMTEFCRLIASTPHNIELTMLPRTLPKIFETCDLKVLEKLSEDMGTSPSRLLVEYSHHILAHVLLLPEQSTRISFDFMLRILREGSASQTSKIDIQSLIKSCVVPLLAELVVILGDQDRPTALAGEDALNKVAHALQSPTPRGRRIVDIKSLLTTHMLGVVSTINDMLQDLHGKKPIPMKQKILRSLGALMDHIGSGINGVSPQIMATFQTMIGIKPLSEATLSSWNKFLGTLNIEDISPHVGPTSASVTFCWPSLTEEGRTLAVKILRFIVETMKEHPQLNVDDIVDISRISHLAEVNDELTTLRGETTPKDALQRLMRRSLTDNFFVAVQSLRELRNFLSRNQSLIAELASGDVFDPLHGQILSALLGVACKDGEGSELLHDLAFECMSILGALDPDRCEIRFRDPTTIFVNYTAEEKSYEFVKHLISDLLVGAFRSTSDVKYQNRVAYTIQELLKFCGFTSAVVNLGTGPVSVRIRNRWATLDKRVIETVTPLLESRFTQDTVDNLDVQHPIYLHQSSYREWIQRWAGYLIDRVSVDPAKKIFGAFRLSVRQNDVVVAHHILPHLVLNILVTGTDVEREHVRKEMLAVLEDQVNPNSESTPNKRLLSAQAVFMLLDHLNKWIRAARQDLARKKAELNQNSNNKRTREPRQTEEDTQLMTVDSVLSTIDQHLMAKAALQCKSYARALMNFERQIVTLRSRSPTHPDLPEQYERLHEIYAALDEPDGMEGVSTLILSPSLEHQIRQHESTGRWTSAQSCWEVRLQQAPDNVDYHLGLLRCLRNLGHYDTLRTHVRGVLTRHPEWETELAGFHAESAWMMGAWEDVANVVDKITGQEPQNAQIVMARILLAMRRRDDDDLAQALVDARNVLGAPITSSGVNGYRRSYENVLNLHLTHDLEVIYNRMTSLPHPSRPRRNASAELSRVLTARLSSTLPTFRTREAVLSMRRTAFAVIGSPTSIVSAEIGQSWLTSAKIARKAGQWQTAYSALLQVKQCNVPFSFIESAKLVRAMGEPLRALQELENEMKYMGLLEDVVDLTEDDSNKAMTAKALILRARWMHDSNRFGTQPVRMSFLQATKTHSEWESGHFHIGRYHDECFKNLPAADKEKSRGLKLNVWTVRSFVRALELGSKFVYQTIPRLLTIWLDTGENPQLQTDESFTKLNDLVSKAIKTVPPFKWYTAFPQIVSRVGHSNSSVYPHLSALIEGVLTAYPKQALWLFASVVKSTKHLRQQRGREILNRIRNNPALSSTTVPKLIDEITTMFNELLLLCDFPVDDGVGHLIMSRHFPRLWGMKRSPLIIPLQESLTANLPATSIDESRHEPFPLDAPTFTDFEDKIGVMSSLAKPRKLNIIGSDGDRYSFLGKPKDDLRKDARLMDFNSIINKLLKANSESRKRQLRIRTYGVVTLNEECGFIQWVPNTIPIRPCLLKLYTAKGCRGWTSDMFAIFRQIKDETTDRAVIDIYTKKILPHFPPVFHEWFIETFPEPSAWLASRLAFGRTAAVMSMVGFVLGLGDRHCENILLDVNSGDAIHVDFNCLFEKGASLETPERVPFRLTPNIVDGLGITGVEGVFRIASEVTMQLLRDNRESLMSVLDAFIHDPLVEWEDEKRKLERNRNNVRQNAGLTQLAKKALDPIEKKLRGLYISNSKGKITKEITTTNLVQMLIQEATDVANLARMYPGWAPFH